jgi:hypothetical protein
MPAVIVANNSRGGILFVGFLFLVIGIIVVLGGALVFGAVLMLIGGAMLYFFWDYVPPQSIVQPYTTTPIVEIGGPPIVELGGPGFGNRGFHNQGFHNPGAHGHRR